MAKMTVEDYDKQVDNAIEHLKQDPENKEFAMHLYNFKSELKKILQMEKISSGTRNQVKKIIEKINNFQAEYYSNG